MFFVFLRKVNTVIITNFYFRTPMTHTMPKWLRRVFLNILPRLLWMESPKLREKREEQELLLAMNNIEQSVILQNPIHLLNQQKQKSKPTDKVNFFFYSQSEENFIGFIYRIVVNRMHHFFRMLIINVEHRLF